MKKSQEVGKGGSKLDTGAGCENLQPAKFCRLQNFATLQNFCSVPNFTPFCSIFLMTFVPSSAWILRVRIALKIFA